MENIILSGMVEEFGRRHSLGGESPDKLFEKFANYCTLKTDHYDSFDFDRVSTGECIGVDGAAIAINGILIDEIDEAEQLTQAQFDAKFTFIQAKTSSSFDLGEYLKFTSTVKAFFGKDAGAVPDELKELYKIKERIYGQAAKMRSLPEISLSYVYTGSYKLADSQVELQINKESEWFENSPYLCSTFKVRILDGQGITRAYRETQNEVRQKIPFQRHMSLPPIKGAQSAYLGVMACKDFIALIERATGELNKSLFVDNVRDFLGDRAPVNEDIAKTILDSQERDRFAILNNGVTIVAKKIVPSGDYFEISQFQVVNGCQTSNVLYKNRERLTDGMYLTVKLIETSDVDLSGRIIATTNSQSQVTKEAFATIRPYHRVLEDYFDAMRSKGYRYFYERRPHQFDETSGVMQQEIVSAPLLIKSFVSLALGEPHKVHYYYGTLLQEYTRDGDTQLFSDSDYPGLYFAVHHIVALAKKRAAKSPLLRNWSYQLAFLVKEVIAPELSQSSQISDKKFMALMAKIDKLFDDNFDFAVATLKELNPSRNDNRIPATTSALLSLHRKRLSKRGLPKLAGAPSATVASSSVNDLPDGRYIGVFRGLDGVLGVVKYGPFEVKAQITPDIDKAQIDARVVLVVESGVAKIIGSI